MFIMLFNFIPFAYITNLTSHDLIMEIMQILFIHNLYVHLLILCIKNTFDTQIYRKMQNLCDIIHLNSHFIYQHIYSCVKHVFNT